MNDINYQNIALNWLHTTPLMPNHKNCNIGNEKKSINYSYHKAYEQLYGINAKPKLGGYEMEDDYNGF